MKLCRDCKHCEPDVLDGRWPWSKPIVNYRYAMCNRLEKVSFHLVSGEEDVVGKIHCDIERNHPGGMCGKLGSFWEPIK